MDRATELAEAGLRVQLGESVSMALASLWFSWTSTPDPGFEQILRQTRAGEGFSNAIGISLGAGASTSMVEFQRSLAEDLAALSPHILVGVGSGAGEASLTWELTDAAGRNLAPGLGDFGTLENSAFTSLADPFALGRGTALLTRLGSSLYEWRFNSTASGSESFDLGVSLPRSDGSVGFHSFSAVPVNPGDTGRLSLDLLDSSAVLTLEIDRDGDGIFEDVIAETAQENVSVPPPALLAATVIGPETLSGADPWGRVVALVFDREMRSAEIGDTSNYVVEENVVLSSFLQLSGRLAFLFVESPVSDLVPRRITVSSLFDTTGQAFSSSAQTIQSRLEDDGAVVSGRVLNADGTPVSGAEVLYINSVRGNRIGISQKTVGTDGRYQFDYVRRSPDGPFFIRARDPVTGSVQELSTRVAFDGEHIVIDLVLLGRGGVTGTVRNLVGEPVPNAQVLVSSEVDPSSFFQTETDGEGRYVATGIVVGPVTVKAVFETSSGLAAGNLQRAGTFTTVDVNINLTVGSVTGGVFELAQDVQTAVADIEVFYLVPDPGSFREFVAASTRTDANGLYGFVDVPVPSGDLKIVAVDRVRSRQASATASFGPGQTLLSGVDVFFIVEQFGAVEVTVHDAAGAPVHSTR